MQEIDKRPATCRACELMKPKGQMNPTHFASKQPAQTSTPGEDGWIIVQNKKLHILAEPVWVCDNCKERYETINPSTS